MTAEALELSFYFLLSFASDACLESASWRDARDQARKAALVGAIILPGIRHGWDGDREAVGREVRIDDARNIIGIFLYRPDDTADSRRINAYVLRCRCAVTAAILQIIDRADGADARDGSLDDSIDVCRSRRNNVILRIIGIVHDAVHC